MSKVRLHELSEVRDEYNEIYLEIEEAFQDNNKKLKNFELDYFEHNQKNDEFCLSMSRGAGDDLEIFDMSGEYLDDEVCILNATFSKVTDNQDLYDSERFEMDFYDDEEHDTET